MNYRLNSFVALFGIGCAVAGFAVGQSDIFERETVAMPLRAGKSSYQYINPLLLCLGDENHTFSEFRPLKNAIEKVTTVAKDSGSIISASVYFRDLSTGQWTGLDENDLYTPASLLKVPLYIAYLKRAESDPLVLKQKFFYEQEPGQAPPLVSAPLLTSGRSYTVEELLKGMIIDSDNTAKNMLESRMDKGFLNEVYSELGIASPYASSQPYSISTRTYALFFRVLYNATFLNHDMSERALALMSEVRFDKGIRAGTPKEVAVSDKYGFAILKRDEPRIIELSDCGIVHEPTRPYLLCVMARGGRCGHNRVVHCEGS
jgi:beta-lactamase class A